MRANFMRLARMRIKSLCRINYFLAALTALLNWTRGRAAPALQRFDPIDDNLGKGSGMADHHTHLLTPYESFLMILVPRNFKFRPVARKELDDSGQY
jgi:hypothetical protein